MKRILLIIAVLAAFSTTSQAQKFAVSTNAFYWAYYGTINAEMSMSVAQHVSLQLGGRYNPWNFSSGDTARYMKEKCAYFGFRYWPWYVYSGWWVGAKGQYKDFNVTNLPPYPGSLREGKSVGGGLSAGYTLMLKKNWNIEFSAGLWGGYHLDYNVWASAAKKEVLKSGPRPFVDMDEIGITFMYIF